MKITATKKKNTAYPDHSTSRYVWEIRAVKDGVVHVGYANDAAKKVLEDLFREVTRPPRLSEVVMAIVHANRGQ